MRFTRFVQLLATAATLSGCASAGGRAPGQRVEDARTQQLRAEFQVEPDAPRLDWLGLIGEYGPDTLSRWYVLERDQRLWILDTTGNYVPLSPENDAVFRAPVAPVPVAGVVTFHLDSSGRALSVQASGRTMSRRAVGPEAGEPQLKISPLRPVDELRREALAAQPPVERPASRSPSLVELVKMDTSIHLDVRYATTNNFLGTPLYEQARAFLQEDAAEALVKVNQTLKRYGFGLLVHDAYRPWYVTRIFWDATPDSLRWLVANPAEGSKHNRGAAVDLTLYDLETGAAVDMPSTYDESTSRARADYPGGTSRERWHRALLRRAMEQLGFVANPQEWWHFDFKDWNRYPIMNVPFDQIGR